MTISRTTPPSATYLVIHTVVKLVGIGQNPFRYQKCRQISSQYFKVIYAIDGIHQEYSALLRDSGGYRLYPAFLFYLVLFFSLSRFMRA
jgi:hypothetical protein